MGLKIKVEVKIERPVDLTAQLFSTPGNTAKWLTGLDSFELVSGELGEVGAQANVTFVDGLTKLKMVETIQAIDLPERYVLKYESDGFEAFSFNRFHHHDEGITKFVMEQHIEFKGAMKMAGLFAKSGIRKQMLKDAKAFKAFAEAI